MGRPQQRSRTDTTHENVSADNRTRLDNQRRYFENSSDWSGDFDINQGLFARQQGGRAVPPLSLASLALNTTMGESMGVRVRYNLII